MKMIGEATTLFINYPQTEKLNSLLIDLYIAFYQLLQLISIAYNAKTGAIILI